jgi:hypothetical protein
LINKAGTVYDVAKGRASPLALASLGAPVPGGGKGIGSLSNIFQGGGRDFLGNVGKGISGLIRGGGADNVGNFGRIGDFFGGIGDAVGITDFASQANPGVVLGRLSANNPEINDIVSEGVSAGKSMDTILDEVTAMGYGGSGGGFMKVANTVGGMMGAQTPAFGSEAAVNTIEDYLSQFPDQRAGINAMLASGITEDELAVQLLALPEYQPSTQPQQRTGSFIGGTRTPDAIRGIEDVVKRMLGVDGGKESDGMFGNINMRDVGAVGLAGLLGKLAYDETKGRKGVPLTPSVVMNAAGRFNLENEIARRSGTAAPNPVEFGLLPQGTLPTLSGGRAPTQAQAQLEQRKATGMRYGGPVMAFAEGGNVDVAEFKRMDGDINGPGTEVSDDIPAMLSDGEFVMTGRAVRGAGAFDMKNNNGIITLTPGNGENRERGTKLMYEMMDLFKEFATEPEAVS